MSGPARLKGRSGRPAKNGSFRDFLLSGGLRQTRTRELIFSEIFTSGPLHPNAAEVRRRLLAKGHRVSLATVYRTLKLLVRSGMVSAVDLGEDHSHYEPQVSRPGHGHFICLTCGRVREFEDQGLQDLMTRLGRAESFKVGKYSLQVFGACRECRKK